MSCLERAITDGHAKFSGEGEHAGRRRLRRAPGRLRAMRETGFETVSYVRGFPRGRGKLRPWRARSRFHQGDPNNDLQPVSQEALIGAIKKMNRCSRRPSPAGGRIVVTAIGKDFPAPCRSSAAVPGCECRRRLAANSIAERDACVTKFMQDYAAPTALERIELNIPIKFSTRFGIGRKP
jgi:hypothetical protein